MSNCPKCNTANPDKSKFCSQCGHTFNYSQTGKLNTDTLLEGRYLIIKTLGQGGMGAVYLALDQRLNNSAVAIKEMSTSTVKAGNLQNAISAFKQEASMLIKLRHPALPRIMDFFPVGADRWYLVMDFIEGVSLQQVVEQTGPIPENEVLQWAKQIGEILSYLHEQNPPIIFRDLKPSNIMLTPNGAIKLIDFGIARHFNQAGSVDTTQYGSHGFSPPEQYGTGQTDPRADIYSLGATLHCLLSGRDPKNNVFNFTPLRQIATVSAQTETAVMRALEMNPDHRPRNIQQFMALLPSTDNKPAPGRIGEVSPSALTDANVTAPLAANRPNVGVSQSGSEIATMPLQYPVYADGINTPAMTDAKPKNTTAMKKTAIISMIVLLLIAGFATINILQNKEKENRSRYEAYLQAGIEAFKQKDYIKAETNYEQALALYQEAETYLNLAKTYLSENNNEKVISYLTDLTNTGKLENNSQVKYLLGSAYYNMNDYKNAIQFFEQAVGDGAISAGNDYETAYRDLAVSYARTGDYDKAQEILAEITSGNGFNKHIAHYVSGELSLLKQDFTKAREEFAAAIRLDPRNSRYKISMAQLYSELNQKGLPVFEKIENYRLAVNLLNEIQRDDQFNVMALNELGKAYYELGLLYESQGNSESQTMYQEGIVTFNKMLDLGMEDIEILVNVGILQDKSGNTSEAEKAYNRALKLDANSSRANLVYGLFKLKEKEYDTAYKYLSKTVQLNQNQAEVSVAQAKIDELREKGWI